MIQNFTTQRSHIVKKDKISYNVVSYKNNFSLLPRISNSMLPEDAKSEGQIIGLYRMQMHLLV